jgi:hypothetical protein
MHRWYSRPVLFVADLPRALRFYLDDLGFRKDWHSDNGTGMVCQVSRSECEIILCQDADRHRRARLLASSWPRWNIEEEAAVGMNAQPGRRSGRCPE